MSNLIGALGWSVDVEIALDIDHDPVPSDSVIQSQVHAQGEFLFGGEGIASWRYDGLATVNAAGTITSFIGEIHLAVSLFGASDSNTWTVSTNGGSTGGITFRMPGLHVCAEASTFGTLDVFDGPGPNDLSTYLERDTSLTTLLSLSLFGHTVTVSPTAIGGAQSYDIESGGQVWASRLYVALADLGPGTTHVDQQVSIDSNFGGSSVVGCTSSYADPVVGITASAHSTPDVSPALPAFGGTVDAVIPLDGISGVGEASAALDFRPDRPIVMDIKVTALKLDYPDALSVVLTGMDATGLTTKTLSSGARTESFTQQQAAGNTRASIGSVTGDVYSPGVDDSDDYSADTYAIVSAKLQIASLLTAGEDTRLDRLRMLCWRYNPLRLEHADSVTVDLGSSLTPGGSFGGSWSGTGGASVTVIGSDIRISGGTGATRSFTHPVSFSGYPTLRFAITSSVADSPFTVTIGSKQWVVQTGPTPGVPANVDVDLSAEHNGPSVSSADSHWEINPADDLSLVEKDYFGVWRADAIVITGLDAGETYDIDSIIIRRGHTTLLDFLPTFYRGRAIHDPVDDIDEDWPQKQREDYEVSESGTTTETWARRFLRAQTRGQFTLECADALLQRTRGGATLVTTITHLIQTIGALADTINAVNADGTIVNPGWTATKLVVPGAACLTDPFPSLTDCRLSTAAPATELCGGGLFWDGSDWRYFDEYSIATGGGNAEPTACLLADRLTDWIPVGDMFDNNPSLDAPHTIYLKVAGILRSAGDGEVLGAAHERYDGTAATPPLDVVELSVSGSSKGTGDIDAEGVWRIDDAGPYAKTQLTNRLAWGSKMSDDTGYARHYRRVVFWDGESEEEASDVVLYRDASRWAYFYRVRPSDGHLVVHRYHDQPSDPTTAPSTFVVDSSGNAKLPDAFRTPEDIHFCAFLIGTTLKLSTSLDAARTWGAAVTIPGSCERFRMAWHYGRIVVVKFNATAWKVQVGTLDPSTGAFSWSSEVALLAAGVAIGAGDLFVRPDNVIEFGYVTAGGAPTVIRCHTLASDATGTWY